MIETHAPGACTVKMWKAHLSDAQQHPSSCQKLHVSGAGWSFRRERSFYALAPNNLDAPIFGPNLQTPLRI